MLQYKYTKKLLPKATLAAADLVAVERGPSNAWSAFLILLGLCRGQGRQWLRHAPRAHLGVVQDALLGEPPALDHALDDERKRLLDVDLEAGAGLHEAAAALARPLQPRGRRHSPALLQVALVAGDDLDGRDGPGAGAGAGVRGADAGDAGALGIVEADLGLHVDELVKVLEGVERVARGDVVDHEEGVGAQVGGGPHAAILLLAGGVGEAQGRSRTSTRSGRAAE
ncbi:hypothetical protein Trco_005159 [Trichoderma cornu-damae]|uniref:Uncharacterized protein n=1 Tax=Trichoderma cornu-damae TaxID=654480 RepID=A0A9P8TSF4_9HYPO|nr:hypothetical protein Trco_005159 [Trichoderma cornu-damae]